MKISLTYVCVLFWMAFASGQRADVVFPLSVGGTPGGEADLVTARAYGPGGRMEREWLPLVAEGNEGGFVAAPLPLSGWGHLGAEEAPHAFASTEYEDSPLDRPLRETGPGH